MSHFLSDAHKEDLHASGLDEATIVARGYVSATSDAEAAAMSSDDAYPWTLAKNQHVAGLILPAFMERGTNGYNRAGRAQVKPDKPLVGTSGEPMKYVSPRGVAQLFDMGATTLPEATGTPRVILTEGIKKGDALRQEFPDDVVIALQSASGSLLTKKGLIRPDIFVQVEDFIKHKSVFYLCFDSDMATNPDVWIGVDKMRAGLESYEVEVRIVQIPQEGDTKIGIDDFYAARGGAVVQSLFTLASTGMPPAPKKDGRRRPKSQEQVALEDALEDYMFYLDNQRRFLDDGECARLWSDKQGDKLLFDPVAGFPYLFVDADRVYTRVRSDMPAGEVLRWMQRMIDNEEILKPPDKDKSVRKSGRVGMKIYHKAMRARTMLTDKMRGVTKCRNVAAAIATRPEHNTADFCVEAYDHLLPLTGGMSIDFSQPPGTASGAGAMLVPFGCPLVPTPSDARFTWCSPVSVEEYLQAGSDESTCGVSADFDEFITAIASEDEDTRIALRGFLAYLLHGARKQRFFVLHGEGRNGKGVLLRAASYILGEGALNTDAKAFVGKDNRHDAHWLDHRNRRAVFCADPAGWINDTKVLSYAGGDGVQGEVKGGDALRFMPRGALVFHGQADRIKFRISDIAITERLHAIKLLRTFTADEQDSSLDKRLQADAATILCGLSHEAHEYHNAIRGLKASEDFVGEETWREGRFELLKDANNVARFVDDYFFEVDAHGGDSDVTVECIYNHYLMWCKRIGEDAMTNRNGDFVKQLKSAHPCISERRVQEGGKARKYLDGIYFDSSVDDKDKHPDGYFPERSEWTRDVE